MLIAERPFASDKLARARRVVRAWGRVIRLSFARLWGRDVMLYVGGVSFFALLAIFPALALSVSLYGLLVTPEQALDQAATLARFLPLDAQALFQDELTRFITASHRALSAQSLFAFLVGGYAAHRGIKALIAGLTFIHEEDKPLSFVRFNVLALVVGISAFVMGVGASAAFLFARALGKLLNVPTVGGALFRNEWTWATVGLSLGLMLLYRFAMSTVPVGWRASSIAGAVAALLFLAASQLCAVYVSQIANLGATYGSVGAVVIFLVWLSWNVNAIFFGGALATEIEVALARPDHSLLRSRRPRLPAL